MISNIPAFAVHQDYQKRHSDMLAAARGYVLSPNQVAATRKVNHYIPSKVITWTPKVEANSYF